MACGQHVEFLAVVGFIDQDYRYKSPAAWIRHDAALAPIHLPGIKPETCVWDSDSAPTSLAADSIIGYYIKILFILKINCGQLLDWEVADLIKKVDIIRLDGA